jgi:hypothetical protein
MAEWPQPLVIPAPGSGTGTGGSAAASSATGRTATSSNSRNGSVHGSGASSSSSSSSVSYLSHPPSSLVALPVAAGSIMSLSSVSPPLPPNAPASGVFTDYPTPAIFDEEQAKLWVTVSVPPKYPDPPSGTLAAAQATDGKLPSLPLRLSHEVRYLATSPASYYIILLETINVIIKQ